MLQQIKERERDMDQRKGEGEKSLYIEEKEFIFKGERKRERD